MFDVVVGTMEDFSIVVGLVAMVPKVAGEGEHVWVEITERDVVVNDPVCVRAGAGEEGGARRMADGLLTVGALEKATLAGQLVDVGGEGQFGPVASKLGAEVVNRDEEDVGSF